jgi:hypothetical protein
MPRISLLFLAFIAITSPAVLIAAQLPTAALVDEGHRLADLLRIGRSVISNNQDLINDPAKGDKGLTSGVFLQKVNAAYQHQFGVPLLNGSLTAEQERLTRAQLAAMAHVMDANQTLINTQGMGFKGFIPAVFARLVNESFVNEMGAEAKIKVTAPSELVRNRKARPDEWETTVIDEKFRRSDWPKGEAFFEEIASGKITMFRMLIPEYYSASCLNCHGAPKGEMDVTGFPKEGGSEGDLAGAISIILTR